MFKLLLNDVLYTEQTTFLFFVTERELFNYVVLQNYLCVNITVVRLAYLCKNAYIVEFFVFFFFVKCLSTYSHALFLFGHHAAD